MRRLFLTATLIVWSATAQAGTYGTELPFVVGSGARVSAMGLAGVSLYRGASSQYFNPAALAQQQTKHFEFYRTVLFDSRSLYHTASYAHPSLDYGTFGVSVLRLDVGGIEERDINNTLLDSDLKDSQTRVLLGYAYSITPMIDAGFNLKLDSHQFGSFSGSGVGGDIAVAAKKTLSETTAFRELRAGVMFENIIEPSVKLDRDDVVDPLRVSMGAGLHTAFSEFAFVTALDVVKPRFSPTQVRFGQEIVYREDYAFRFGFDGSTPTVGVGGTYRGVTLDYAFRSENLGTNHRFALGYAFGPTVNERRDQRRNRFEDELQSRLQSKVDELETQQLKQMLTEADELFETRTWATAKDRYEMVLVWDNEHPHARDRVEACNFEIEIEKAQGNLAVQDYVTALYHLRIANELRPNDPTVATLVEECNDHLAQAKNRSEMIESMLKRAIDTYAAGQFPQSLAGFEQVLKIDPSNVLANEYRRKAEINIENERQRLVVRARTEAERGNLDNAMRALRQAQTLVPDDAIVRSEIARIEEMLRKRRIANTRSLNKPPTTTTTPRKEPRSRNTYDKRIVSERFRTGVQELERGEYDRAARTLLEVWTIAPDYNDVGEMLARAYLFIGMKSYSDGQYENAIRVWEKALTVDPTNTKARRYLSKAKEEVSKLSSKP